MLLALAQAITCVQRMAKISDGKFNMLAHVGMLSRKARLASADRDGAATARVSAATGTAITRAGDCSYALST